MRLVPKVAQVAPQASTTGAPAIDPATSQALIEAMMKLLIDSGQGDKVQQLMVEASTQKA